MPNLWLTLGQRLEFAGYFSKLPFAGTYKVRLEFFESAGLVEVHSKAEDDQASDLVMRTSSSKELAEACPWVNTPTLITASNSSVEKSSGPPKTI